MDTLRRWHSPKGEWPEYYDDDETEFMLAMQKYKETHNRRFPAWSEVLAVLKSLGYRKVKAIENEP